MDEQELKNAVGGVLQQRIGELVSEYETRLAAREVRFNSERRELQQQIEGLTAEIARLSAEGQNGLVPEATDTTEAVTED